MARMTEQTEREPISAQMMFIAQRQRFLSSREEVKFRDRNIVALSALEAEQKMKRYDAYEAQRKAEDEMSNIIRAIREIDQGVKVTRVVTKDGDTFQYEATFAQAFVRMKHVKTKRTNGYVAAAVGVPENGTVVRIYEGVRPSRGVGRIEEEMDHAKALAEVWLKQFTAREWLKGRNINVENLPDPDSLPLPEGFVPTKLKSKAEAA